MANRYFLTLNCHYCGHKNCPDNEGQCPGIYFIDDENEYTFKCEKCGKINLVEMEFKAAPYHIKRSQK